MIEWKALVVKGEPQSFWMYLHLDQGMLQLLLSFSLVYSRKKTQISTTI